MTDTKRFLPLLAASNALMGLALLWPWLDWCSTAIWRLCLSPC